MARRHVVHGELVCLRYPTRLDKREVVALKRASRAFLEPWEATPRGGPSGFTGAWFDRMLKTSRTNEGHRFLVCRVEDGVVVGQIGLGGIVRGAFESAYVGYWIGAAYAGRGHMTEALRLAIGFAFDGLGLHRVEANIIPENAASRGLAKKVGMRYEGTAERYLRIAGRWQDHEHWAITVEEWRTRGPRGVRRGERRARRAR